MSIFDTLAEATRKASAVPTVKRVRADGAFPLFGRRALLISARTANGLAVWHLPLSFLRSCTFAVGKEEDAWRVKVSLANEDHANHVVCVGPLASQAEADQVITSIAAAMKPSRWRYFWPAMLLFILWLALSPAQVQTQPQAVRQSSLGQGPAGASNYPLPPALVSATPVPSGMVGPQVQPVAPPAAPVITQAAPGAATTDKNDPFGLKIAPAGK